MNPGFNEWAGSMYDQAPFLPPPYMKQDIPLDEAVQTAGFKFFSQFFKASSDYVKTKTSKLNLLHKLYNNEIGIREWSGWESGTSTYNSRRKKDDSLDYLSNYVYPIAPNVNTLAYSIYNQLFSGPEWFIVTAENPTVPEAPNDIPTSFKLQLLLKELLHRGDVETLTLQALIQWIVFGTICAKVNWFTYGVKNIGIYNGVPVVEPNTVYECPVIQPIPLNQWLPDPVATCSDVNRWRAIGHRTVRTYEEVLETFESGGYFLNQGQFVERFHNASGSRTYSHDSGILDHDVKSDYVEQDLHLVKLWEGHGRYPSPFGLIEGMCTIATELNAESPDGGVMIKLTTAPVLESGLRPFALCHYNEQPGPYGKGMIEENEANIYIVSQFIGQLQDLARYTASAARLVRTNSATARWIDQNGGIKPGDAIPFDQKDDLLPVPSPNQDINTINAVKSEILGIIEKVTSVTDTFQGFSAGSRVTATHAGIMQHQSQIPSTARGMLFASKFIERAWNLALCFVAQNTTRSHQIVVKDFNGQFTPVSITPEEIQQSKWQVKPSLTAQDYTSMAKAQSIVQVLQMLGDLQPALQAEGKAVSYGELFQRYLELIKLGNTDRVVQTLSSREQETMRQNQEMQQHIQMLEQQLQRLQRSGNAGQGAPPQEQPSPTPPTGAQQTPSGGPAGPSPTDENMMAQFLQQMAFNNLGGDDATPKF